MTQRDTVTVAVLFMKPAFVTTPRNDMGGMLSKTQRCVSAVVVVVSSSFSPRRAPDDGLPFLGLSVIVAY
jgi:hypothetical protein